MDAAMTLRNTSRSSASNGKAISSALIRSLRVWSLTSLKPARSRRTDVEQVRGHPLAHRLVCDATRVLEIRGGQRAGRTSDPRSGAMRPARRVLQRVGDLTDVRRPRSGSASRATSAGWRGPRVQRPAVARLDQHHEPGLCGVPERVRETLPAFRSRRPGR